MFPLLREKVERGPWRCWWNGKIAQSPLLRRRLLRLLEWVGKEKGSARKVGVDRESRPRPSLEKGIKEWSQRVWSGVSDDDDDGEGGARARVCVVRLPQNRLWCPGFPVCVRKNDLRSDKVPGNVEHADVEAGPASKHAAADVQAATGALGTCVFYGCVDGLAGVCDGDGAAAVGGAHGLA